MKFVNIKNKEKNLNAVSNLSFDSDKEIRFKLTSDSCELQDTRQWNNIFSILRENNFEDRILHPPKLLFN